MSRITGGELAESKSYILPNLTGSVDELKRLEELIEQESNTKKESNGKWTTENEAYLNDLVCRYDAEKKRRHDDEEELRKLKAEREAEAKRIQQETQRELSRKASQKVTKKLIPYGTRILVKRRKVEDKSSHIILPDEVKNLPTDIADVIEVPEQTFTDQKLIANAGAIVESLTIKACSGDASAVRALLDFKEYLQVMTIKRGDVLLMARYGGTDFLIQETNQMLCVAEASGIYAFVKEIKQNAV